jgi:undecaprenyl-diphosphatase
MQERVDDLAFDIADGLYSQPVADVVAQVSALGSRAVVIVLVAVSAVWAAARGRRLDALVLPVGLLLTLLAVDVAKEAYDRPRPPGAHVATSGAAYPSGHAAFAVAWVACAVVLVRCGAGFASRFAAVATAVALVVAIALTRVYLRAHYLSDVEGGIGMATAIFALVGLAAVVVGHLRQNERPQR